MQPYRLSAVAAAAEIASKQLSPVELVDSVLARIEAVDGRVGAFVTVTAEQARAQAKAAADEIAAGRYRGPLHGVSVGVKDLVDTKGHVGPMARTVADVAAMLQVLRHSVADALFDVKLRAACRSREL